MVTAKKKKGPARTARGGMQQQERVKTDVRMAPELMEEIERVCLKMGTTKNAFFVLASAYLCGMMGPVMDAPDAKALAFLHGEIAKVLNPKT